MVSNWIPTTQKVPKLPRLNNQLAGRLSHGTRLLVSRRNNFFFKFTELYWAKFRYIFLDCFPGRFSHLKKLKINCYKSIFYSLFSGDQFWPTRQCGWAKFERWFSDPGSLSHFLPDLYTQIFVLRIRLMSNKKIGTFTKTANFCRSSTRYLEDFVRLTP